MGTKNGELKISEGTKAFNYLFNHPKIINKDL